MISPYLRDLRKKIGNDLVLLPSVCLLIWDNQERLLLMRSTDFGLWQTIGGAIDPDESPEEAAKREALEEANIKIEITSLCGVVGGPEFRITYPNQHQCAYVCIVYNAKIIGGEPKADKEEASELKWWSKADLTTADLADHAKILLNKVGIMTVPTYKIVEGSEEWADRCREFCRRAYEAAYTRPERGITKDLFSKEIFSSPRIVQYYKDLCVSDENRKIWLALDKENDILGMVVAQNEPGYCNMRAFYVKPELKGQGIGHALYQKILDFAGDQPIQVDVVEYMQDTIDMYKHWGFHIDEAKGKLVYPIVEWPESARQAYQAIYLTKLPPHKI